MEPMKTWESVLGFEEQGFKTDGAIIFFSSVSVSEMIQIGIRLKLT